MNKYFLIICIVFFSTALHSQMIDTVCVGTIRNYKVHGDTGSTYCWHINGGNIISNPVKDSITVQWGNNSGIYQLFVIETNTYGCHGDTVYGQVLIKQDIPISINGINEICYGDSTTLTAVNAINYNWNTGSSLQNITVQPLTNTQYRLIGYSNCKTDTAFFSITVNPLPVADFSYTPETPEVGEKIRLKYTGSAVLNYYWFDELNSFFSNMANPDFIIKNPENTTIGLLVSNQFGCFDSINKTIITSGNIKLWIPNSFTPDNDGLNDIFKAESSSDFNDFQIYIYNRWGQLIFESKDINTGWDGKYLNTDVSPGVYTWVIIYNSTNNPKMNNQKSGHLTLFR